MPKPIKKLILFLLMALLLTACGHTKENDQEAVYMNITAQEAKEIMDAEEGYICLLYTSPSPRDRQKSRMPSSA